MYKLLFGAVLGVSVMIGAGNAFNSAPNYDKMMNSVVMIEVFDKNMHRTVGKGSGVITDNGVVVTASHVIPDDPRFEYRGTTVDGKKFTFKIIKDLPEKDLAVLRPSIELGKDRQSKFSCQAVKVGQNIIPMGNPTFLNFITTTGKVAGARRHQDEFADDEEHLNSENDVVIIDATIIPGMSGGPVFDENGEVVGINDSVLLAPAKDTASFTGLGAMVAGEAVCDILKTLKNK